MSVKQGEHTMAQKYFCAIDLGAFQSKFIFNSSV